MKKFIESITETNSKLKEFKIYNEIINNLIYKNKWQKTIDKEL